MASQVFHLPYRTAHLKFDGQLCAASVYILKYIGRSISTVSKLT